MKKQPGMSSGYMIANQRGDTVLFRPTMLQCQLLEALDPTKDNLVICFRRTGVTTMLEFIRKNLWPDLKCTTVIGGPKTDWIGIEERTSNDPDFNVIIMPFKYLNR